MARAGKHPGSQVVTPLRQARLAIPATLEAVCADLDKSAPDGSSGITDNGWLWGRGSSDSKVRCDLLSPRRPAGRRLRSAVWALGAAVRPFDLDEHTGGFGGAKQYFEGDGAPSDVAGVMIGYPGMDRLVIGGRGVYRTQLHVHGTSSHSGGSKSTPNAIEKAAHLTRALSELELPDGATEEFPLPGKLTVTAITGGRGYSVTPDLCAINVDIRTTLSFDDPAAAPADFIRLAQVIVGGWRC